MFVVEYLDPNKGPCGSFRTLVVPVLARSVYGIVTFASKLGITICVTRTNNRFSLGPSLMALAGTLCKSKSKLSDSAYIRPGVINALAQVLRYSY